MKFKEQLKDALCNNDISFLRENLNHFAINERFEDEDNDTLLLYTLSDAKSEAYKFLLKNNADVQLLNDEGEGVLHAIVFSGDTVRLHEILKAHELDINHRSKDGSTALLLAVSIEEFDMAKLLITYGANVNIADNESVSPLHVAIQFDNLDLLNYLLENGADVFHKSNKGNLSLALAVNYGHISIIKKLYITMYGGE